MVPAFTELNMEEPQQFYLGTSGLEELADGRIKHGEAVLPFHSQVLATQSSVLRDLFRSLRTTGESAAQAGMIELESPFHDFSLEEVLYFLRFAYQFTDANPTNLKAAAAHVPGIIRLAHSLDVSGALMSAADEYVGSEMTSAAAALKWTPLTETCNLKSAWSLGIRLLAVEMSTRSGDPRAAHAAARKLSNILSQDSFVSLMAAVASACCSSSQAVPAANLLEQWKAADLQPVEYTYLVEGFSNQRSSMNSPVFLAAGLWWRLRVELKDDHLGLFLVNCNTSLWYPTAYTLELNYQLSGKVCSKGMLHYTFTKIQNCEHGHSPFIKLDDLRNTPGYIVDDTIKFRVRIALDK